MIAAQKKSQRNGLAEGRTSFRVNNGSFGGPSRSLSAVSTNGAMTSGAIHGRIQDAPATANHSAPPQKVQTHEPTIRILMRWIVAGAADEVASVI